MVKLFNSNQFQLQRGDVWSGLSEPSVSPLGLDGLNVLAYYNFADASTVWADSGRTTPATEDGALIGVTDLSGNDVHGVFTGIGGIWRDGVCSQPKERNGTNPASPVFTGCLRMVDFPMNTRALGVHLLWEPVSRYGSLNTGAWWFSDYTVSTIATQHDLDTTSAASPSRMIYPGVSGSPWANQLPLHADRMAFSLRYNNTDCRSFRDGSILTHANPAYSYTGTGMNLFGGVSANGWGNGFMGYNLRAVVFTDGAESDARIQQLHTDFQGQWSGLAATKATNYFFAGDSLTVGEGADNLPFWRQVMMTNSTIRPWVGAVGGTAASGKRLAGLQPVFAPDAYMPSMDHVVLWIGFNDCKFGYSASDIQTDIAAWITSYAGSSYTICTIAPEFFLTGADLTTKDTVNAWIRSTYGANVLDLDTVGLVANGGSDDFYNIPGGSRDTVHLSAQGHYKVAIALATKLGLTAPASL